MDFQGTCLQTYIPVRAEARSGAEMVSSLIFGESYTISERENGFLKIKTVFDAYEGWISANSFSEQVEYNTINEQLFLEAHGEHQKMFIPCGALIPENRKIYLDGQVFILENKLKTTHHIPQRIRVQKLARSFLNTPYLWGGRTFMGIDCSGFTQVVYKAIGKNLSRDTGTQVNEGTTVDFSDIQSCDLVFFSKPETEKATHVGIALDRGWVIHSSGKVKIEELKPEGIFRDKELVYKTVKVQRILS